MENKQEYYKSEEFHELLNRYETSIHENRKEYFGSEELTNIAEYYYNYGNMQMAINTLDYAIDLHPGATMPLVFRARIALLDYNDFESAHHYMSLIDDTLDLDYLYLKTDILIRENHADEASRFLHEAMDKIDEEDVPDYVLDVATIFIDYNLPELAEEWLNLSDEYDLQDYRELKARIAFAKGNYAKSEKIFEQLLDEDPYSTHYWNSLASTQFMGNQISEAITSSEYSIAINPNDEEALFNKANGLFSLGNYEEALKYYERFAKLSPNKDIAMSFIGNCLLNMGRAKEALPYYDKAVSAMHKQKLLNIEIIQCMAFAYSEIKEYDKALEYVDKAMELANDKEKLELLVTRGQIQLEKGNAKTAIRCFLEALKKSSFSHDIFFRIAVSVYDCGYMPIAYRMFKSYVDMHSQPGDEGAAYLASCCNKLKRRSEYLKYLKLSCEINPTEASRVLGNKFPQGMNPHNFYDYEMKMESDDNIQPES